MAEHQKKVLEYFPTSPYKGLLLFHKLGSGKTCTSIAVADEMLKRNMINRVYILSPGSLRSGWISEYCRVCGRSSEYLHRYFTFITYNTNIHKEIDILDFNNSLVIIDELHNMLNGVKNQSINATTIYNKLMRSNCRILALSGTPIVHRCIEWNILGNLLKPGTFSSCLEKEFTVTDQQLKGIVSYFPGETGMYPTVIYKPIIKVKMTPQQYNKYVRTYKYEYLLKPPDPRLKFINSIEYEIKLRDYIRAKKFEASRRVSNVYYDGRYCFFPEILDKDGIKVQLPKPDKLTSEGCWIDNRALSDKNLLNIFSPKFTAIIINILLHYNTKHVIFSWYKTKGGVDMINTLLNKCGITAIVYSGDVSSKKRQDILDIFNSPSNRNGNKIRVLLITDAGAEGINILETNNIHIVESIFY